MPQAIQGSRKEQRPEARQRLPPALGCRAGCWQHSYSHALWCHSWHPVLSRPCLMGMGHPECGCRFCPLGPQIPVSVGEGGGQLLLVPANSRELCHTQDLPARPQGRLGVGLAPKPQPRASPGSPAAPETPDPPPAPRCVGWYRSGYWTAWYQEGCPRPHLSPQRSGHSLQPHPHSLSELGDSDPLTWYIFMGHLPLVQSPLNAPYWDQRSSRKQEHPLRPGEGRSLRTTWMGPGPQFTEGPTKGSRGSCSAPSEAPASASSSAKWITVMSALPTEVVLRVPGT